MPYDQRTATDLSRIRNSFVIARNTAFTFKGKNIDTKEISARNWACVMSSKALCSATRTGCALTRNLLMARPALISGPIGSSKASPISSSYKIRLWLVGKIGRVSRYDGTLKLLDCRVEPTLAKLGKTQVHVPDAAEGIAGV